MNRLYYPQNKISPYIITALAYALYVALFILLFDRVGWAIAPFSIIPVISGAWYFGIRGGLLSTTLCILINILLFSGFEHFPGGFVRDPADVVGSIALLLSAVVIGKMSTAMRERRDAINKLDSLNEITRTTLEASDLQSTLKGLVERIARLFQADDAFFAFWDEENKITIPMIAHGSMSEIYPKINFEPGERTLAAAVMELGHPLAIPDLKSSSYFSPKVASLFPSRSMLGIPLIIQGNKLASFYLGYNSSRHFNQDEIAYAESAARQIALALTKIQLLEEAQRRVKQLTVLHEVALVATQVDTIDRLIERVTEIIGKNLFPDNFGVLLMDEEKGFLHPHPSYRFVSAKDLSPADIAVGQGVTGQVAQTGQAVRIGNIADIQNYVDIDQRTSSELCVPIKLKDRILGVINAESTKTDAFSFDDELLLGTLASQLATAIEQIRTAQTERRWLSQLAHSNELINALAHITTQIEKALSQEAIIQTLGEELKKIGLTCAVAVCNIDQRLFTIKYVSMQPAALERLEKSIGVPLVGYTFSLDELNSVSNAEDLLQPTIIINPEDHQLFFPDWREEVLLETGQSMEDDPETRHLRLPLIFEETLLGILWGWSQTIRGIDLPVMSIFAKQIASALERARLFQEVQSLALTDPLTGLQNRRSLFELGRIEFARSNRTNRPFCCMLLDVDHFKQINDNYGHLIGDQVLREFAKRSKRSVREVDLIGRYGGEEFVIFLPETDLDTALHVAERLRASIERTPIKVSAQDLNITVSIGVATKDQNTIELQTLIARADQAMYVAKYKGRNQVATSK